MDATTAAEHLVDGTPARHRHRVGALSILFVWAFYFALNTMRMALAGPYHQLAMSGRRAAVTIFGMGLTWILYFVIRRVDRARMPVRLAVAFTASVPVAFGHAAFNYYAFYVYAPIDFWPQEIQHVIAYHSTPFTSIVDAAAEWYFFIAAWAVLYIALSTAEQTRQAEAQAARFRAQAQNAQLRALRYQLNPHFLFNTLNSLSALVLRRNPDQAEQMIETLAAFLRATLTTDPTEDATLADEIRVQRLYLDIEQVRFPDRLRVSIDIPDALQEARIPSLLLQPLVENAIKYGVARTTRPVTIAIEATAENATLHLRVSDDGPAMPTPIAGHGVGLRNVAARLLTRFGTDAGCTAGARAEGGYRVELHMPLQRTTVHAA
jgi:two-component system LytT family sensor kinase